MKIEHVSFKMTYISFPCVQYKVKYGEKLPILAFAASLLGRLCNAYIPRPIDSIAHSLAHVLYPVSRFSAPRIRNNNFNLISSR